MKSLLMVTMELMGLMVLLKRQMILTLRKTSKWKKVVRIQMNRFAITGIIIAWQTGILKQRMEDYRNIEPWSGRRQQSKSKEEKNWKLSCQSSWPYTQGFFFNSPWMQSNFCYVFSHGQNMLLQFSLKFHCSPDMFNVDDNLKNSQ